MKDWRIYGQRALIAFLIIGQLYAILKQHDFFPFSPYPMYSQIYTPEYLRTHQVWLVYEDGEREYLQIQNYFPSLWNAAFIESLLYENISVSICSKLAGFSQHHKKHSNQKLRAIEVWRSWLPWQDFVRNTLNQTTDYDHLERKLLAHCPAVAN